MGHRVPVLCISEPAAVVFPFFIADEKKDVLIQVLRHRLRSPDADDHARLLPGVGLEGVAPKAQDRDDPDLQEQPGAQVGPGRAAHGQRHVDRAELQESHQRRGRRRQQRGPGQLHSAREKFDVVIVDPPAFIKRRKDQSKGEAAYKRLNQLAMQLLATYGLGKISTQGVSGSRESKMFTIGYDYYMSKRTDLYALDLAEQWQREHANFRVVPVLSEPDPDGAWGGRTGLVHEAMLADFPDLTGHEVYVCGSVKMVEAAVPAFLAQGLGEGFCFSDAFTPSQAAMAVQAAQAAQVAR